MNLRSLMGATALVLSLCWPGLCLAQETGTVSGTLKLRKKKELPNVVVFVDGVAGDFPAPAESAVMDQKNLKFIPHILPVVKGTTVEFLNSDEVLHNVFTPDGCADKMNLGTWAKGEKRSYKFDELGCKSVLLCKVHPEMEAFVVVLGHPFFASPDESGKYTISGVPAGSYALKTWHQKYGEKSAPVQVEAGKTVTVDLDL